MLKHLLAAAGMAAAPVIYAQVDVVESTPVGVPAAVPMAQPAVPPMQATGNIQAELFYQLQVLQQEVLELRGLVEEQAHELKRLKQQRLDDYLDLDRRLSGLSLGVVSGSSQEGQPDAEGASTPDGQSVAALEGEGQSYRTAYDLLKQRKVDEAVTAFTEHLNGYPTGKYAANAHYWLGEIHLLKNDLEAARQSFTTLLDSFADHRKVPDAKFKLGKVYDLMGDKAKARTLLEEVAASDADASRLAKNYLQANFP